MNYERSGLLLPEPTQKPIDNDLHETMQAARLDTVATYEELNVPDGRKKQLEADFLASGRTLDVDLTVDPEIIDTGEIQARIASLKQWKRELLADESVAPDLKRAYRWQVNELIANNNMILASANGDVRNFRRWNEFVYGRPDEAIYRAALDWVAADAERLSGHENETVATAARSVLGELEGKRGYRELLIPDSDLFRSVKDHHYQEGGYYSLLLDGTELPTEGTIKPEIGDVALHHVLQNNLESDYGVQDASGATWSVSHSRAAVLRPKNYSMTVKRFQGLALGHEVGSHLLEKVNGSRGPVKLAETGLDRTELGNEGRAVIREQVPYDTFDQFGKLLRWQDILRRNIAIGYGEGVGEDGPKRFSEVYRFINLIDTMYQAAKTPDDNEIIESKAHSRSWNLLIRVQKGTNGEGGAYMKDKVYLEGNVACWLTAALRGPQAIADGDLGKYDINNPRHIALLQTYGLLPVME